MQSLYFPTRLLQSSCGSSALLNSIHSSRADFSSLQTQHGLTFSPSAGFKFDARLLGVEGWVTEAGCAGVGDELNQPILALTRRSKSDLFGRDAHLGRGCTGATETEVEWGS